MTRLSAFFCISGITVVSGLFNLYRGSDDQTWQRQFDIILNEFFNNTDIYLLLNIHVFIVIRGIDDMHHLIGQPILTKGQ